MSEVKFSEDTWKVQEEPAFGVGGELVTLVVDRHGNPVANCGSGTLGAVNALLVSAAPALLRAVILLRDQDLGEAEWTEVDDAVQEVIRRLERHLP